tara:strand:+ start:267 stop:1214 length:948 start_codon:yes stop_codon:yes gene_type:complete
MLQFNAENYQAIFETNFFPLEISIMDHMGGFDVEFKNSILDHISSVVTQPTTILTYYIVNDYVKKNYPNLIFKLDPFQGRLCQLFNTYTQHPTIELENFICSFNGSDHVSRKLLVSILQKFGYFSLDYCSKNFTYTTDILDGHIHDYVSDDNSFFRKFFISDDSEEFFQSINSFGHVRYKHNKNIYNLESKLTKSFLHIVSETMATNCHPFISEKPFYSIVTRGLFVSYAQPGWHEHFEKYVGFKKYTKLFDYRFDNIQNPVERLVELVTMIGKFSKLTPFEWHDLYLIEQDNIEFNYDHYFSKNYLAELKKYEN